MTYAAWFELHRDPEILASALALRVYSSLVGDSRVFLEEREVKIWPLASALHAHPHRVRAALDLLIRRGYVIEHARGPHNVRRVTVPIRRQEAPASVGLIPDHKSPTPSREHDLMSEPS